MSFLSIIEMVLGLFDKDGFINKHLAWIVAILLGVVLFFSINRCQHERSERLQGEALQAMNLRAIEDKTQEMEVIAKTREEKLLAVKDAEINDILDSMDIKIKHLNSLKVITLTKVKSVLVPQYDTLYELIEASNNIPDTFNIKIDECLKIRGVFTGGGLRVTGDRTITINDINYFKRRNLWGLERTPKWGKKEMYQTVVTNCGDTITRNKKITFNKL